MRALVTRLTSNRRITTVLTTVMALLVGFAVTLITVTDVLNQRQLSRRKFDEAGLLLVRTLNDVVSDLLYFRDIEGLRNISNLVQGQPEIKAFMVLDTKGRVLTSGGEGKYPVGRVELPDWSLVGSAPEIYHTETGIEMVSPVTIGSEIVGALLLRFETGPLAREMRAMVLQHLVQLLMILGLVMVISYLLAQAFVRPVRQLIEVTEKIAGGDLDLAPASDGPGEIADLTKAMHKMAHHLRETERRTAEEERVRLRDSNVELERSKLAAERAKKAKNLLLAKVSHELRTPLNAIMGTASLVADSALTPEHREPINVILSASRDLAALIEDLLDVSSAEAGKLTLAHRPFGLRRTLALMVAEARSRAAAKGLSLELTEVGPEVPDSLVGDERRLKQILFNLVGNAIKFTDEGLITVAVAEADRDEATIKLAFSVSDTGAGIPEKRQREVFDSFVQLRDPDSIAHEGVGLGLSICRDLALLMGGRVELDSRSGRGSTFRFSARFELSKGEPNRSAGGERATPSRRQPSLRVLLAEDDVASRMVAASMLERLGHTVTTASHGGEAVEKFEPGSYDVVFLDLQMPELDGFQVATVIRGMEESGEHVPIVALTAHAIEGYQERCLAVGMNGYLAKPIEIEKIAKSIRGVVGNGAAEGNAE